MHQQKFDAMRELIDQQRYDEARALLQTIDHPLSQKWLDRLDEADPAALSPSERQLQRQQEREAHIRQWMEQERRIARSTALALFVFAVYLWQFETVFWSLSPDLVVRLLPALVFGAGVYLIWNVRDDKRLRGQIVRMKAGELRNVSYVLLPSAGLLTLLTLVAGNTAQFFVAAFLVAISILNLWRAAQAQKL
jgi:hypothetical protein